MLGSCKVAQKRPQWQKNFAWPTCKRRVSLITMIKQKHFFVFWDGPWICIARALSQGHVTASSASTTYYNEIAQKVHFQSRPSGDGIDSAWLASAKLPWATQHSTTIDDIRDTSKLHTYHNIRMSATTTNYTLTATSVRPGRLGTSLDTTSYGHAQLKMDRKCFQTHCSYDFQATPVTAATLM